jgi:endonuclease-3
MASSTRAKAADRQAILKKLLPLVKKQYKVPLPKFDRPVMETMIYAVCLEGASVEQADAAYARFLQLFPDLNEARVSSIAELAPAFAGMEDVDWRAFRTRSVLQYVFDKTYSFELEGLRKKTLELATKQLAKIRHLTPFVRTYTLQQVIGAHVLPLDDASARFLAWLGLVQADQPLDEMGEGLKSAVRKAEAHQFCFTIRAAAVDPALKTAYDHRHFAHPAEGHDPGTAIDRLTTLFKQGISAAAKFAAVAAPEPEPAKKGTKAVAAPKKAATKAAEKPAAKTPEKAAEKPAKAPAEKPASEKTATEKPVVAKATADKATGEKAAAKKPVKAPPAKAAKPAAKPADKAKPAKKAKS